LKAVKPSAIFLVLILWLGIEDGYAKGRYRPGDWVSYTNFRYVTSIAYDHDHVYFGTTGGILRLNRYRETWEFPFTTSDGMIDSRVRRLAYDPSKDELWADTYSGTAMYQPTFEEWYGGGVFPAELVQSEEGRLNLTDLFMEFGYTYVSEGYILGPQLRRFDFTAHLQDNWQNLWIGTWGLGPGLIKLRNYDLTLKRFGLFSRDVQAVCLDGDDIWFGGAGDEDGRQGITRYDTRSEEWSYYEAPFVSGLPSAEVTAISADDNFVWFGTNQGLVRYERHSDSFTRFSTFSGLENDLVSCLEATDDGLWVGTIAGVNLLELKGGNRDSLNLRGLPKGERLSNLHMYDIKRDTNYVWLATELGILLRSNMGGAWQSFLIPDGQLSGVVTAIETWDKEVWFASPRGVLLFELEGEKSTVYIPPGTIPERGIIKLAVNGDRVFMGTNIGLYELDKKSGVFIHFTSQDGLLDDQVQTLALDGDYIWCGTPKGVTKFYWNNPSRLDY
jgi:ligand-binding sensor domain-containing protein